MTERVLSHVQAAEIGFLRRVHATFRDKVRSCEFCKTLNMGPLLRMERSQLRWFGHVTRMSQEILARPVLLAEPTECGPEVVQGPGGVTTSPTLLGPALVWSQQNYTRLLKTVKYS